MILSKNLYKKAIKIFIYQILYLHFILILKKYLYNINLTIITKVFFKLIFSFYLKL